MVRRKVSGFLPAGDLTPVQTPTVVGRWIAPALIVVTLAVFVVFTFAWMSDRPAVITPRHAAFQPVVNGNLYALLAAGFMKGQLSLDATPADELLASPNPYDPAKRPGVLYLHDASLFRGRYYLYFGPAPAVFLFLPFRAATGLDLPAPYAVLFSVVAAYAGLIATANLIQRRHFPHLNSSTRTAGLLALSGATMLFPLARRPGVYEVAISFGVAAVSWALFCALAARGKRASRWAAACGGLFGLAAAARPTLVLLSLPAFLLLRSDDRPAWRDRRVWTAALIGAVFVFALLAYNQTRFGRPFEFGQSYQLSGQNEGAVHHFALRFIPAQLWYYVASPLRLSAFFPFLRPTAEVTPPPGFGIHEYSFGLWANFPILWFGVVCAVASFRRTTTCNLTTPFVLAAIVSLVPLLAYFGSCVRYEAEFAPWFAMSAALGLCLVDRTIGARRWARRFSLAAGWVSFVVGVCACLDMYASTSLDGPRLFERFGYWLNRPAVAWRTKQIGPDGATAIRFVPPLDALPHTLLRVQGPDRDAETLWWRRTGERAGELRVRRDGEGTFEFVASVAFESNEEQTVVANLSSLYPPRAMEMRRETPPVEFRVLKRWATIDWNGQRIIEQPVLATKWRPTTVDVPLAGGSGAKVLAVVRGLRVPMAKAVPFGGVRLRVAWGHDQIGHSFPLAVTGHSGRGNLFVLEILDRESIRLGYDHWGKPALRSPSLPLGVGRHTIEFWMPSIAGGDEPVPLRVLIDGQPVWQVEVPFYRVEPREVFIARDPLGGTACEAVFPGAQIEEVGLEWEK